MWTYQDCVDEFARRRKGSFTKKTHRNVYMRHEGNESFSEFTFKMYRTDIVRIRKVFDTNRAHHSITFYNSNTTRDRIYDITGVRIFGHPNSTQWHPVNQTRAYWMTRRFKVGDKVVEVKGYPFEDGMIFRNGEPEGDFSTEQFKVLDPAAELARKRQVRPWLDAIKVAVELTLDDKFRDEGYSMRALTALTEAVQRGEPCDMALVLEAVHAARWYGSHKFRMWRNVEHIKNLQKEVYASITQSLLANTRRIVPYIMVTGYLLDADK